MPRMMMIVIFMWLRCLDNHNGAPRHHLPSLHIRTTRVPNQWTTSTRDMFISWTIVCTALSANLHNEDGDDGNQLQRCRRLSWSWQLTGGAIHRVWTWDGSPTFHKLSACAQALYREGLQSGQEGKMVMMMMMMMMMKIGGVSGWDVE